MSVKIIYECDGCIERSEPIVMGREFKGITGRNYGFGSYKYEQPKDHAPKGWIAYDSIGCCYCPDCANELFPPEQS